MSVAVAPMWPGVGVRLASALGDAVMPPRVQILIFHRVLAVPDPLFPGEIDARRFDRIAGLLARAFRVFTLGQAVDRLRSGTLPPRALVITFDDGYADNAEIALPILRRHGLSATFFVATGFLDGGRMWNDSVIECVRACRSARIDLHEFGLTALPVELPAQRRAAIDALLPRIKHLPLAERNAAVARLRTLAGTPPLPDDLMMRREQVRALAKAGMEIGGHTVRHPILCSVPDADAEAEIADGRHALQAMVDASVDVFAYPNGRPGRDYDGRHVAMVRRLGFRAAVSTAPGVAVRGDDTLQLPRFTPWDQSSGAWAARLLTTRWRSGHELAPAVP